VRSPTFSPKVAKNDLVNQFNHLAWGWHIVEGREFEAPTSESSKMVAALLLEKMQQHFRSSRCPIITDLAHSVRQKFQLAVQPLHKARDIVSNFKVLGFRTKAL
jgi:hypothetical protein